MALPHMDSDPTVLTPRSATFPLTTDSTVRNAWERLCASGGTAEVITRDGRPVAVVTRPAVEQALAAGMVDTPVDRVADLVPVAVDRSADALAALHAFTRAAWEWLIHERGR